MSAKKTNNKSDLMTMDEVVMRNAEVREENERLANELADLYEMNRDLVKENADLQDHLSAEHKKRMRERHDSARIITELTETAGRLETQLKVAKELRESEKRKRQASVRKFLSVSAVAFSLLCVPGILYKLAVIDIQPAFGITSVLLMVIAWCYALIFDRSRK